MARIFKVGGTRIVEDDSTRQLNNEQVRLKLKTMYPEVANATVQERAAEDGNTIIEFLPQPGRKG
jgi:PRTRC genetic system protein C